MSSDSAVFPPGSIRNERIKKLSRDEFLDYFGEHYGLGQHVTFIGPTQRGKTTLCHQIFSQPAVVEKLKKQGITVVQR